MIYSDLKSCKQTWNKGLWMDHNLDILWTQLNDLMEQFPLQCCISLPNKCTEMDTKPFKHFKSEKIFEAAFWLLNEWCQEWLRVVAAFQYGNWATCQDIWDGCLDSVTILLVVFLICFISLVIADPPSNSGHSGDTGLTLEDLKFKLETYSQASCPLRGSSVNLSLWPPSPLNFFTAYHRHSSLRVLSLASSCSHAMPSNTHTV